MVGVYNPIKSPVKAECLTRFLPATHCTQSEEHHITQSKTPFEHTGTPSYISGYISGYWNTHKKTTHGKVGLVHIPLLPFSFTLPLNMQLQIRSFLLKGKFQVLAGVNTTNSLASKIRPRPRIAPR